MLRVERVHLVQQERHALPLEVAREELPRDLDDTPERLVQHRFVQRVLRGEVVQHRRLVRARRVRDLLHGDAGEAAFSEQLRRGVDDRLAPVHALPYLTIQW